MFLQRINMQILRLFKNKRLILWLFAILLGIVIELIFGRLAVMDFIATVYTRLFQFLAVPTIALAIVSTMSELGKHENAGKIFRHTISYTLITTFLAALVGLGLYIVIRPGNLPETLINSGSAPDILNKSYLDHILSIVPNNIVSPFLEGNVLSILLLAFAVGFALYKLPESQSKTSVQNLVQGLQELLFSLIRGLIWTLPLALMAFSAQLAAQFGEGMSFNSLGKYTLIILGGNLIQFFIILPAMLALRGVNPIKHFMAMSPAVVMAFFTKSSAATLPVTMNSAETRGGVRKEVSRFVLPICTTINMNGCAAFILVTSLFLMQNGGFQITAYTMMLWLAISILSAIGNAGVPMGCYFMTLSLMTGIGAPVAIMGLILPIYTVIDMVETAENVWSDSCVCAMTNNDIYGNR